MDRNRTLHELADILSKASAQARMEENLHPSLADVYRGAFVSIKRLDEIAKKFSARPLKLEDLQEIYAAWKQASRFVKISQVRLVVIGRGYAEYGETAFRSLDELEDQIASFDPAKNVFDRILTTDSHQLVFVSEP